MKTTLLLIIFVQALVLFYMYINFTNGRNKK